MCIGTASESALLGRRITLQHIGTHAPHENMLSLASGLLDPNSGKAAAAQVCDLLKIEVIGSLDFMKCSAG